MNSGRRIATLGLVVAAAVFVAACTSPQVAQQTSALDRVENIVVIYAENRSFDHLYGTFPGAEGLADARPEQYVQLDHDGKPMPTLPAVWTADGKPDPRFPRDLPNRPFRIDAPPINMGLDKIVPSPIHQFWQNQEQINGGANNHFAAASTVGGWVMGTFDGSKMRMWQWAHDYTLADHFFMGAFGGSFLNHFWLVCACTPEFREAPASMRAQVDANGHLKRKPSSPASALQGPVQLYDGQVTPDGYAVNTSQPPYQPSGTPPAPGGNLDFADPAKYPVTPQRNRTIGDTLTSKGVSWAWYAGGWDRALADGRREPSAERMVIYSSRPGSPIFVAHHQPFNYFQRFAPGTVDRAEHLKDEADFVAAIDAGTLPSVSFFKPAGRYTEHPGITDIKSGDEHITMLLERLRKSAQWSKMAVIVTYDENGGFWDHVPPPAGPGWSDRWGPGSRVAAIIISPFARRGFVDKTVYDTTSIIKFITLRFGLQALPGVREKVGDLTSAFAFDGGS